MKILKLNTPEEYYQLLLKTPSHQGFYSTETASAKEWRELVLLLTIGETYFFRDRGQIDLLKNKILPELIEIKQKSYKTSKELKPVLRVWSAGCSTGEEPFG